MSFILLAVEEQPAWRLWDDEDNKDLDAGGHSDPPFKKVKNEELVSTAIRLFKNEKCKKYLLKK